LPAQGRYLKSTINAMKSFSRLMRRTRGWGRAWQRHVTQPLGKTLAAGWNRTLAWSRGRSVRLFLQGLPALAAAVGLLVLTGLSLTAPTHEVESRYHAQGRAAFQAGDYRLAMTCFERVCAGGGDDRPEALYELALTAEAMGQMERALLIMRQLAPPDRQGYGEAHLWFAIRLQQGGVQTKEVRQARQAHLLRALQGDLKNRELAHGMLGELYLADGQLDQAEAHLARAVKSLPKYRITLAVTYELRGKRELAAAEAQAAVQFFQPRSKANLNDHGARLSWAQAVTFLKRFPEAVAILEEGWAVSRDPVFRVALGGVYTEWCNYQVIVKGEKAQDQLGLVEKGLFADPTNVALLNRLLAAVSAKGAEADQARATLRALLAGGKATAMAHFALGVDAWHRGEKQEARDHWEQAHKQAPHLTAVANNLAMFLADADPPDLPRALELINLVLEQAPEEANFRDTRGQIYMKLGKWREALTDLETALGKTPAPGAGLHRRLATVYDQLGNAAMAAEHQRRAEQLAAKKQDKK
jgi:tetratricopeptide (TPR) repeat protein